MRNFSIGICAQYLVSGYNLETSTTADRDLIVGLDLFCAHSYSSAMTN